MSSWDPLNDLWVNGQPGCKFGLLTLTAVNLFNFIDRYVPSAVKESIKTDLDLTDFQTSLPLSLFIVVYMLTSPIFGHLSDQGWSRRKLIAFGIAMWSLATALGAIAKSFGLFLFARMLVGIGEAAYGAITPSLIADYFRPAQRNRHTLLLSQALSFFYLAIPVGAAIGFGMGGALGAAFGWRAAFAICGLPGVALAVLCLYIEEPTKGASEVDLPAGVTVADGAFDTQQDQDHEQQQRTLSVESHTEMSTSGRPSLLGHKHRSFSTGRGGGGSDDDLPYTGGGDDDTPYSGGGGGNGDDLSAGKVHAEIIVNAGWMSALRVMWADKAFVYTLVGVTLVTFASGGMADWFTTYLIRVQGFAETEASTYSGLMTVVGGIGGTISGSVLSDRMKASGRVALPEFVMMASSILLSAVFAFAALSVPGTSKFLVVLFLFLTQYFLWFYSGPSNAVMCNVHVSVRARAFAISILVQHALGDAIASPVIGAISGAGAGANTPSRREIQSNMSGKEPNKEPNN